jgi:hypothetical protein
MDGDNYIGDKRFIIFFIEAFHAGEVFKNDEYFILVKRVDGTSYVIGSACQPADFRNDNFLKLFSFGRCKKCGEVWPVSAGLCGRHLAGYDPPDFKFLLLAEPRQLNELTFGILLLRTHPCQQAHVTHIYRLFSVNLFWRK